MTVAWPAGNQAPGGGLLTPCHILLSKLVAALAMVTTYKRRPFGICSFSMKFATPSLSGVFKPERAGGRRVGVYEERSGSRRRIQ